MQISYFRTFEFLNSLILELLKFPAFYVSKFLNMQISYFQTSKLLIIQIANYWIIQLSSLRTPKFWNLNISYSFERSNSQNF